MNLTLKAKELLESAKNKRTIDESGEHVLHLKIAELVLGHCNIVNNDYQDPRVLCMFNPNKSFGQLLD